MNCVFCLDGVVRFVDGVEKYIDGFQKARNFPPSVKFADIRKKADELWTPTDVSTRLRAFVNGTMCELEDDEDVGVILSQCSRNPNASVQVWMVIQSVEKTKKKKTINRRSNQGKSAVDNFDTTQPDHAESRAQSLGTPQTIIGNPLRGLTPLGSFIAPSTLVNRERVGRFSPDRPMVGSDEEVYRPDCSTLPTSPTLPPVRPMVGSDEEEDSVARDFLNAARSELGESWVLDSHVRRSLDYGYVSHSSGECSQPTGDGHDSYFFVSAPPGAGGVPRQSSIPNVPEHEDGDDSDFATASTRLPRASSPPGAVAGAGAGVQRQSSIPSAPEHEDGGDSDFATAPPRAPRASSSPGDVPREARQKRKLPMEGSGGRRKKKQKGAEDCASKKRAPGYSRWEEENVEPHDGFEANYQNAVRPEYINFKVGQQFKDKETFIFAYTTFAVYHALKVKRDHSSSTKIIVRCTGSGKEKCSWRLYAKQTNLSVFSIVTFTEIHSCCRTGVLQRHHASVDVKWIATIIEPYVMARPNYSIDLLRLYFRVHYGMDIAYKQIWNAKERALEKGRGSFASSYQKLVTYGDELHKADPESVRIFHLDKVGSLERFFWTYGEAVKTYRKYLRRVIVIDATFLTGRSYGTLFTACAMDADRHIFPIGFAIAQGESENNWSFFLDNLNQHVLVAGEPVIIMSDRHRSIVTTVAKHFPHCLHSFCAQHIRGNLGSSGVGDLFMKLSNTYTEEKFNTILEKIREKSVKSHTRINGIGHIHWSELHILHGGWRRYGVYTSNHVESWHKVISSSRSQPIHVLLQDIRTKCMDRYKSFGDKARLLKSRLSESTEWTLNENTELGRNYKVKSCSDALFEVTTPEETHVVDLDASGCSCNYWQVFGIPCSHAIKCMALKELDPVLSCDPCYSRDTVVATYQEIWRPTLGQSQWVDNPEGKIIGTPPKKKKAGRPPGKRWRRPIWGKPVQRRTCFKCGSNWHNIRTCDLSGLQNPLVRTKG